MLFDSRDKFVKELNDPIASRTGWGRNGNYSDSLDYELIEENPNVLKFLSIKYPITKLIKAISSLILFVIIFCTIIYFVHFFLRMDADKQNEIIAHPFGRTSIVTALATYSPLLIIVLLMLPSYMSKAFKSAVIVFDKQNAVFWKGRNKLNEISNYKKLKYFKKMNEIHALQLIAWGEDADSFQLNLVLKNAKRIAITSYSDLNKALQDATQVSGFLDIPFWDYATPIHAMIKNDKVIVSLRFFDNILRMFS